MQVQQFLGDDLRYELAAFMLHRTHPCHIVESLRRNTRRDDIDDTRVCGSRVNARIICEIFRCVM